MVQMDYSRPLEAIIPGTTGKVLGVLARTDAELPNSSRSAACPRFADGQHRRSAGSLLSASSPVGSWQPRPS